MADSSYAALELLAGCQALSAPVTGIIRLRLDAALYTPAPPRRPPQIGRPRLKGQSLPTLAAVAGDPATVWTPITIPDWYGTGARRVEVHSDTAVWYHTGLPPVPLRWVLIRDPHGKFDTQALLCTDGAVAPEQIVAWFVRRWQLEVTFEEARRHLGVETQRQWSERAIRGTTPVLLGLFSLVTLLTDSSVRQTPVRVRQAAWYPKAQPTFADALALIRRELWAQAAFPLSVGEPDLVKVPRRLVECLTETLCYAA